MTVYIRTFNAEEIDYLDSGSKYDITDASADMGGRPWGTPANFVITVKEEGGPLFGTHNIIVIDQNHEEYETMVFAYKSIVEETGRTA